MSDGLLRGRFDNDPSQLMQKFSSSVHIDKELAPYDIQGSKAHTQMLAKVGLISEEQKEKLLQGLEQIWEEIQKGNFVWKDELEDVHMNIESALQKIVPEVAPLLHTARSRNDQVMCDVFLYLKDHACQIQDKINLLQNTLLDTANQLNKTVLPGYTHLQHGQPVLLSHHLLAYVEMLERDYERFSDLLKRLDFCPLGSGALAGSSLSIDREYTAELLGFKSPSRNSMDSVSDRDQILEMLSHISILGVHISRMSEELVLWSSKEFSFVRLSDQYTTGSSAMPQKRNPDSVELVRGKVSALIAHFVQVVSLMKGLSLTYHRDFQEDKLPLFQSVQTCLDCLSLLNQVLISAEFQSDNMKKGVRKDGSCALDVAEYLVEKGMPFREAYTLIGEVVSECEKNSKSLEDLRFEELSEYSNLFEKDVEKRLNAVASPKWKKSYGSTNPKEVKKQLNFWKKKLNKREK